MDKKTEREMLEEATGWIMKLENAPEDSPLFGQLNDWLAECEEHSQAWENANKTWHILGAVKQAPGDSNWSTEPQRQEHKTGNSVTAAPEVPAPVHRSYRRPVSITVAALAAALIVWIAGPALLLALHADYRTATAQTQLVRMEEGSIVELGAASAIETDVGTSERRVTLLAGEAFFDVESDPDRPFFVNGEGLEVKTLGTAFNVRLSSTSTTVALLRGSIEVAAKDVEQSPATLVPGQVLVIDRSTGTVSIDTVPLEDIGSWRQGRAFLLNATVEDAVDLIRRYHNAWIMIPDRSLASRKVSGLFDLNDPDRALATLVRPFDGKVRSATPLIRVISRR